MKKQKENITKEEEDETLDILEYMIINQETINHDDNIKDIKKKV